MSLEPTNMEYSQEKKQQKWILDDVDGLYGDENLQLSYFF